MAGPPPRQISIGAPSLTGGPRRRRLPASKMSGPSSVASRGNVAPAARLPADPSVDADLFKTNPCVQRHACRVGHADPRQEHPVALLFEQGEEWLVKGTTKPLVHGGPRRGRRSLRRPSGRPASHDVRQRMQSLRCFRPPRPRGTRAYDDHTHDAAAGTSDTEARGLDADLTAAIGERRVDLEDIRRRPLGSAWRISIG